MNEELPQLLSAQVRYAKKAQIRLVADNFMLFALFSGNMHCEIQYPTSAEKDVIKAQKLSLSPRLILVPPGTRIDISFADTTTECWYFCFSLAGLSFRPAQRRIFIKNGAHDGGTTLSAMTPLEIVDVDIFRRMIRTIYRGVNRNPSRMRRYAATWLFPALLERLLPQLDRRQGRPSLATQLKNLIDADNGWDRNIKQLGMALSRTPSALRQAFVKKFNITPNEYRAKRRYQQICYYIQYTELTMSEIADSLGMKNRSHLYLFLKRYAETTPAQLAEQLRKPLGE